MFGIKRQPAIRTLIGEGTVIRGEVRFSDGLRIDGEVEGDVVATGDARSILVISDKARITGKVRAGHVIVNGMVTGPVTAEDLLELQPKARITGDVKYHALEMHQGAVIDGELHPLHADDRPSIKLAAVNSSSSS